MTNPLTALLNTTAGTPNINELTKIGPAGFASRIGLTTEGSQGPNKMFKDMLSAPENTNLAQRHIDGIRKVESQDMKDTLTDGNDLAHVVHVNEIVQRIEEASSLIHKGTEAFNKVMSSSI